MRLSNININIEYGYLDLCGHALGMESGFIPDSALKASSYYVHSVGPHQSRLVLKILHLIILLNATVNVSILILCIL